MRKQDFFGWLIVLVLGTLGGLVGTIFFAIWFIGCSDETFTTPEVLDSGPDSGKEEGGFDAKCVATNFCKFSQCGNVDDGCGHKLDCGDCTFCEPWMNNVGIDGGFSPYDCSADTAKIPNSYLCHFGTATMPLCVIKRDTPSYVLYCCP